MRWFKKVPESKLQVDIPSPKQTVWVEETKAFIEYKVEVHRRDGGQHVVEFNTNIVAWEDAVVGLQKFYDQLNSKRWVMLQAEIIREEDIKNCRIEPRVVEHTRRVEREVLP